MQAGRILLERIYNLISRNESFAFETTLSGLSYQRLIKDAKDAGYEIIFFFVYLENYELAKNRVGIRVGKGGHNILPEVIERRYIKGLNNLSAYIKLSNDWYIYDNSEKEYTLIAKSIDGQRK